MVVIANQYNLHGKRSVGDRTQKKGDRTITLSKYTSHKKLRVTFCFAFPFQREIAAGGKFVVLNSIQTGKQLTKKTGRPAAPNKKKCRLK